MACSAASPIAFTASRTPAAVGFPTPDAAVAVRAPRSVERDRARAGATGVHGEERHPMVSVRSHRLRGSELDISVRANFSDL